MMTKVICQNGEEDEFKFFGTCGKFGECVKGMDAHGEWQKIGKYKDWKTALFVVSEMIWHEGKEPYKMPAEDYKIKGN